MLGNIRSDLKNLKEDLHRYSMDEVIDALDSMIDTVDNTTVALNEDRWELMDKISKLEKEIKKIKGGDINATNS